MAQHRKMLDRLFGRIIDQKATPEEQTLFWQWLWKVDARKQATGWTTDEKHAVNERLWGNILLDIHPAPYTVKTHVWKRIVAAAALVGGLVLAAWLWADRPVADKQEKSYVFSSGPHSMRRIVLPDSTEVVLNNNSSLKYISGYNASHRYVTLTGEGYFKVRKDSYRPFIVLADALEVQVLGTAFNIEARTKESQIRVALTEGRVVVNTLDNGANKNMLYPGQMLRYERSSKQFSTSAFTTNVTAWTKGGFSFNSVPLSEALDKLAAHYQLRLRYSSKQLAGKTVTASFGKTGWQNVLSNVLFAHDLKYTMQDSTIIIK